MITVTTSAKKQMASICETSGYAVVRYSLNGGGCSGLIGKWEPETHYEPSEGDMTWSLGEDKVFVIDEFTLQHMEDATIDYEGDFMPAFKVGIPDKQACGCGESFQV
jgi:iron-sulfur cluster assembly accessory protein|tara:strand:+ start:1242 stop:1562 length:321 start_codon:yes stop_codon:yes gene_type:complete